MHYVVELEMEDHGRMLPRVLQALEHAQAASENGQGPGEWSPPPARPN